MIITRAMPTQQTAIIGVSRRITAGQEFKAGPCRAPAYTPVPDRPDTVADRRHTRTLLVTPARHPSATPAQPVLTGTGVPTAPTVCPENVG